MMFENGNGRKRLVLFLFLVFLWPLVIWAESNEDCFDCHDDPNLTGEDELGREISMYVDPAVYESSVHGENDCTDCHEDIDDPEDHDDQLGRVSCVECHDDVQETIAASVHGDKTLKHPEDQPTCVQCHGKHGILTKSDPDSLVSKTRQAKLCLSCHADPEVAKRNKFVVKHAALYDESIHGSLTASGNVKAAICSDCHSGHGMRRAGDPLARIFKANIADTCRPCHEEPYEKFVGSIHGQTLAQGVKDSPTCTDCHGEHEIRRSEDQLAATSGYRMASEVCSPCHESERLTKRYGIAAQRGSSYRNSYHGLASGGGIAEVANCGSCHGYHDILPSDDPSSSIHASNLAATCGVCHENAGENYTKGKIHLVGEGGIVQAVAWVRRIYLVMIFVVLGLMVIHNALDFRYEVKRLREAGNE